MRRADIYIYVHSKLAGKLWEDEEGYHFHCLEMYMKSSSPEAVSLTLSPSNKAYSSRLLFPTHLFH